MSVDLPTILLVEDNEDDVFAMQRALRKAQVSHPLQVVNDGQKALDYLSGTGNYADRNYYPLPSLVFLDLKLPYIHGFEVLAWIREQAKLHGVMVIVLSSSDEESDRVRAQELGAHSYMVKPPEPQNLNRIVSEIAKK
jgi:DNA-binding response OmpR family regulator